MPEWPDRKDFSFLNTICDLCLPKLYFHYYIKFIYIFNWHECERRSFVSFQDISRWKNILTILVCIFCITVFLFTVHECSGKIKIGMKKMLRYSDDFSLFRAFTSMVALQFLCEILSTKSMQHSNVHCTIHEGCIHALVEAV